MSSAFQSSSSSRPLRSISLFQDGGLLGPCRDHSHSIGHGGILSILSRHSRRLSSRSRRRLAATRGLSPLRKTNCLHASLPQVCWSLRIGTNQPRHLFL